MCSISKNYIAASVLTGLSYIGGSIYMLITIGIDEEISYINDYNSLINELEPSFIEYFENEFPGYKLQEILTFDNLTYFGYTLTAILFAWCIIFPIILRCTDGVVSKSIVWLIHLSVFIMVDTWMGILIYTTSGISTSLEIIDILVYSSYDDPNGVRSSFFHLDIYRTSPQGTIIFLCIVNTVWIYLIICIISIMVNEKFCTPIICNKPKKKETNHSQIELSVISE
jgi:hypothetical protein